jgi:tetratricopeptide (TPR) repeat protein
MVLLFLIPALLFAKPSSPAKASFVPTVKQTQAGLEILEQANAIYSSGKYAQAILLYRKADQRGADPVACAFNLANSYFQLEKYPQSAAAYRRAVILSNGENGPILFNLAAVLYRVGAYAESIAAYHRALHIDPENTSAWLYLAEAYARTGDKVGSQRALENARRLDPTDVSLVYQLSELYVAMDEIDRAAAIVREGYALNPQETDFLIYLGDVYRSANRLNDANNSWREALGLQAENVELMYKLADALAESGNNFLAMDYLTKALQIKPKFADAAIFLGNLAFEAKWWDRAEKAYIQAGNAGNIEAVQGLRNLAYEFEQRKMLKQTLIYLNTAQRFAPADASLKNEIANYIEMSRLP